MKIDKETHKVGEINHYKTTNVKTQIVIGLSLRKNNYHIIRLQHKDFGKTKKWNTYTIARDGNIYQHFDNKYHSDFIGIKEADIKSISIVFENMGGLVKSSEGNYINWLNETCDNDNVIKKTWLGYNNWEKISTEQVDSVVSLCKQLCEEHNIPKTCIDFYHYNQDIIKFRGIIFKSNYIENSGEINPMFDIVEFNDKLSNDPI